MEYIIIGLIIILLLSIFIGFYHYGKFIDKNIGSRVYKRYSEAIKYCCLIVFIVGMFVFSHGCSVLIK